MKKKQWKISLFLFAFTWNFKNQFCVIVGYYVVAGKGPMYMCVCIIFDKMVSAICFKLKWESYKNLIIACLETRRICKNTKSVSGQ